MSALALYRVGNESRTFLNCFNTERHRLPPSGEAIERAGEENSERALK